MFSPVLNKLSRKLICKIHYHVSSLVLKMKAYKFTSYSLFQPLRRVVSFYFFNPLGVGGPPAGVPTLRKSSFSGEVPLFEREPTCHHILWQLQSEPPIFTVVLLIGLYYLFLPFLVKKPKGKAYPIGDFRMPSICD